MSKIEAGKFDLHYEEVELHGVIAECMRLLAQRAARANLSVTVAPAADAARGADRRAVKQILVNLITNAIKFTPPDGQHHRRSRRFMATPSRFRVSDEGIGIPEEDLPRLGQTLRAGLRRSHARQGWHRASAWRWCARLPRSMAARCNRQPGRRRHHSDGAPSRSTQARQRSRLNGKGGRFPGRLLHMSISYSAAARRGRFMYLPYSSRAMVRLCTSSGPSASRSVRWLAYMRARPGIGGHARAAPGLDRVVDDLQRHARRGHLDHRRSRCAPPCCRPCPSCRRP